MDLGKLRVKVFCDAADLGVMHEMLDQGLVSGFTCNPTICRKAGVTDYGEFCRVAAGEFPNHSLSLEVIADDDLGMRRQARLLSDLGSNVYVKIPIVDTAGQSNAELIRSLSFQDVRVNVTAVFTHLQIQMAMSCLSCKTPSYVSVFAGRIADAGQCPLSYVQHAISECEGTQTEVIWASVREPYNVLQASSIGCHVITVFPEMLRKLRLFGKDLAEFSRETVQMFVRDAAESGYTL